MGEGFEINMVENVAHFCTGPPQPISSFSRWSVLRTKIAARKRDRVTMWLDVHSEHCCGCISDVSVYY